MITMEKIDYVMDVTNSQYDVVRKALLDNDGDVDKAIESIRGTVGTKIEDNNDKSKKQDFIGNIDFDDIKKALLEIWEQGNATRLVIKKGNDIILNLSLTVSAFGVIFAPIAAFLGAGAGLINDYDFIISMKNGEDIDLKRYILSKYRFF